MSIKLSTMRGLLSNRIGDIVVSGTTDADGNTDKTTAIDSSLAKFPDDYFKTWVFYITSASEGRIVKNFLSPSGAIRVWSAYTEQVESKAAYELHRYDPDNKKIALNQALRDVYPYFYKRLYDTTLYGQKNYGEDPNEFDKFVYTVPSTFNQFPDQVWLLEGYTGTHTGSGDASVLTDSTQDWETNELVGFMLYNKTDGSAGSVESNTDTTATAVLTGGEGTEDDWDEGDEYIIQKPNKKPIRFTNFTVIDPANIGNFQFYADIKEKYIVALVGQAQLTQFENDASTTELTEEQAEVVCLKAAEEFYRTFSSLIDAQDSGRADSLATRRKDDWDKIKDKRRMPILKQTMSVDWGWANG